ncbi:MAG TPA: PQQ-dependent sugar dehydrogenase, partial [Microlunatus sp.]|nr:PQQ-dependent sugar dehydrogenase [Microlunatus sp.]
MRSPAVRFRRRAAPVAAAIVATLAAAVLLGCGPAPADDGGTDPGAGGPGRTVPPTVPDGRPTDVSTGLAAPWSVAFHGDTALISERDTGTVRELITGGGTRVVGVIDDVRHSGESGLLGLAVDDAGRLYAYSTGPDGNRIQRFALTGEPGSLGLGPAETIIDRLPSATFHDGGRIAFGPDGMLYATVGDAGRREAAQDRDVLAGKILRMTPDGEVPDDNPFPGSLVYSLGHRNPQGLAWADDGTLFAAEFGQNTWDELNIIEPGRNYGWPEVEGAAGDDRFVDPVQQWSTDRASPSGIVIIGGTVFVANLRGAVLRAVPVVDPGAAEEFYPGEYGRLRDVVRSPRGELWILTNN